ncbi:MULTISPECIES: hypothetical protein [unclassified Pseudoclavibacter]|uniref:hypothetical protein n=1 Tax=unclassified Pseudoclavibacter TaxID=2615177 RepID=UPI000CE8C8B1|nr:MULTISPECIES: hypothetical protein [unclassified Pseudoclavibacter]MBS3177147.1 hypothetical protein [Pseudoclavibacter sp. Marseille-Q4354]PPG28017.1 hypothetical protein C5B97_14165 [Pseudoclavibacter sp. RFBB5]
MTTPEQPKLPPRKPVELPPIDRTPVEDTSNAAYSALTPRTTADGHPPAEAGTETAAVAASAPRVEVDPAVAHVQANATASASAPTTRSPEPAGLGLSRFALVVSALLSLTAGIVATALSVAVTPSPLWPLYTGASIAAVAVLLAVLARRHRGWVVALVLAAVIAVGCVGFAFAVA